MLKLTARKKAVVFVENYIEKRKVGKWKIDIADYLATGKKLVDTHFHEFEIHGEIRSRHFLISCDTANSVSINGARCREFPSNEFSYRVQRWYSKI
jgi:hypothetical protein